MSQKGNMENREVLELWGSQKKNVKRKMRDISCEQEKTSPKKPLVLVYLTMET